MTRLWFGAVLLLCLAVAGPLRAQELKVERHTLPNGLVVYTHEDHSAPLMSFFVFYQVGSVNEELGITGVSHLFEHMMFNGSEHYAPLQFDRLLEAAGGKSNGYTRKEQTAYLETFPPSAFDLVLDLESDRMASMRITEENLEQERGIVKEERRLRVDNDPAGKLDELMYLQAFVAHPYRTPVVGFMHDLDNIKLADIRRYFDTYYTPNNAVVVIAGDFKTADAVQKVEKAFARVKRGPEVPRVYAFEPAQQGPRRAVLRDQVELPMLMMSWRVPGADQEADMCVLDVAQVLLGMGDSARLQKRLVQELELATELEVYYETLKQESLFTLVAQVAPGKDPAVLEAAIRAEFNRLIGDPVSDAELQKARNQLRASSIRGLKSVESRANLLGYHAVLFGDPLALLRLLEVRDKVTATDVQRVAAAYFKDDRSTVITLMPIENSDQPAAEGN